MPLRKAIPGEEQALLALVSRDPLYNLFLISNLQAGLSDMIEAWVQDGVGLLVRRQANWMIDPGPNPAAFDYDAAAAVVDSFSPDLVRGMSGRPEAVDPLYERLRHRGKVYAEYFAACQDQPVSLTYTGTSRPARPEDLDAMAAIYADASDMSRPRSAVEQMLPNAWVLEDEGAVTCVGAIYARTEQAGMIGGVFTPPQHRRRGYASALVHAMASALAQEGRTACLFYHNPDAGRIYRNLGFRELGAWRLIRFSPV